MYKNISLFLKNHHHTHMVRTQKNSISKKLPRRVHKKVVMVSKQTKKKKRREKKKNADAKGFW
jgi:hypothetical protein